MDLKYKILQEQHILVEFLIFNKVTNKIYSEYILLSPTFPMKMAAGTHGWNSSCQGKIIFITKLKKRLVKVFKKFYEWVIF